jgi:uncharacterized protein (TIGR02453 family)
MNGRAGSASTPKRFEGFPTEALSFLQQLRKHNDREWFARRKPVYEQALRQPMEQLACAVAAACQSRGFALLPKERSAVTRIYRDTRFSPDKRPFHDYVGATLHGRSGVTQAGCLYVQVSPGNSFVAAGMYLPDSAFLRLARLRIFERPAEFLGVVAHLAANKLELSGEWRLKRLPRGFERFGDSAVAEYLKLNCYVVSRPLTPEQLNSPRLVQVITTFALTARPLLEFGWGLGYRREKPGAELDLF